MGLVKLGDASTWKLQETLRATQAAGGTASTAAPAPVAPGVIRLPVSRPAAPLPAAPKPDYKRKAWPGALAEGSLRLGMKALAKGFPAVRMRRR